MGSGGSGGGSGGFFTSGNSPVLYNVGCLEFGYNTLYLGAVAANTNIEVINKPIAYPFRLQSAQTIVKLGARVNAVGTGNFDVGIYDSSFNRVVSIGSTAKSGAVAFQWVTVTTTALSATDYYLVYVTDNAAASSTSAFDTGFANLLAFTGVMELNGTTFPLPASLSPMIACASFTKVHMCGMAKQGATV